MSFVLFLLLLPLVLVSGGKVLFGIDFTNNLAVPAVVVVVHETFTSRGWLTRFFTEKTSRATAITTKATVITTIASKSTMAKIITVTAITKITTVTAMKQ